MNECAPRLSEPPEALGHARELEAAAGDIAHAFNNLLSIITTYTMLVLEDLKPDDPARPDLEEVCRAAERARELTRDLRALAQPSPGVALSV
jgi:signal transduction histidine kinase